MNDVCRVLLLLRVGVVYDWVSFVVCCVVRLMLSCVLVVCRVVVRRVLLNLLSCVCWSDVYRALLCDVWCWLLAGCW